MRFEKVSYLEWIRACNQDATRREKLFYDIVHHEPDDGKPNVVKLWKEIKLPERATVGSAGYDFFAPVDIILHPGELITIPTGIKWTSMELDNGILTNQYFLSIYPRSSLGRDYSIREPNIVSIIDEDYYNNKSNEGHIFINIKNEGTNGPCLIKKGTAYAQGIIQRYYMIDGDHTTKTRTGGFGSTTKEDDK